MLKTFLGYILFFYSIFVFVYGVPLAYLFFVTAPASIYLIPKRRLLYVVLYLLLFLLGLFYT